MNSINLHTVATATLFWTIGWMGASFGERVGTLAFGYLMSRDTTSKKYLVKIDGVSRMTKPSSHSEFVKSQIQSLVDGAREEIDRHLSNGRLNFYVEVDASGDSRILRHVALSLKRGLEEAGYKVYVRHFVGNVDKIEVEIC